MTHKWTVEPTDGIEPGTFYHMSPGEISVPVTHVCDRCGLRRTSQTVQGPDSYLFVVSYWSQNYVFDPTDYQADADGYVTEIIEHGRKGEIGAGRPCR